MTDRKVIEDIIKDAQYEEIGKIQIAALRSLLAENDRFNALTEDGVEKEIYGWLEDVDDAHMNSENELSHFDIAMKIKNDLAKSIMRYVRGKE